MISQAQISLYPLRTESLSEPIERLISILRESGLELKTNAMSTAVKGSSDMLFNAVDKAFKQLSLEYNIVMDIKISNACPLDKS